MKRIILVLVVLAVAAILLVPSMVSVRDREEALTQVTPTPTAEAAEVTPTPTPSPSPSPSPTPGPTPAPSYNPEPGMHRDGGRCYMVDENGLLVTDSTVGTLTFGADGRYTTGDAELDALLDGVLAACETDALSDEEALKAVYLYIKANGTYIRRPAEDNLAQGATGWEFEWGKTFLAEGCTGNCYGFAASFGLLARCLGYEAYIVSGQINQYYEDHGFVVIPEDGTDYIYDVEMEFARPERHPDLELFRTINFDIYYYWYEPWW